MTDKTAEQTEIENLRAHNAELLADLKKAKAKAVELTAQVDTLTGERDTARGDLQRVTLDQPVNQMLDRVAMDGAADLLKTMLAREFAFTLDGAAVVIRDAEGNPVAVPDDKGKPREATFSEADVRALCEASPNKPMYDRLIVGSRATGSGASGPGRGEPTQPDKPASKPAPTQHFGLS